jgi:hypothetical protein
VYDLVYKNAVQIYNKNHRFHHILYLLCYFIRATYFQLKGSNCNKEPHWLDFVRVNNDNSLNPFDSISVTTISARGYIRWSLSATWLARIIDHLRFYVPLKNISLIWRRHHFQWSAAKIRPMLGAQGLWAGRDLYRATPAVIRDLGFSGLIRRTAPFSRLLRYTRGCGGSILTWVSIHKRSYDYD